MYPRRLIPDPIRELAFDDVTSSYVAVGSALDAPARIVRILSTLDQNVYISWDGSTDHQYLVAGSFILIDVTANKVRDDGLFIAQKLQFYAKAPGSLPTTGSVFIEVYKAVGGQQESVPPVSA